MTEQPYGTPPPYGTTPSDAPPAQPYGAPPSYGAPQYGQPQYGAPQYGQPQYGQYGAPVPFAQGYLPPQLGPNMALAKNGRPLQLASAGARVGGFFLSLLLVVVTLVIGYLIWTLVLWGRGQTPAKQILHQRVVSASEGTPASWGHMFIRSFLVGGLLSGLLNTFTFSIYAIVDACFVFSKTHQRLTDRIAGTFVVQE